MEPFVTLQGVQKLDGGAPLQASRGNRQDMNAGVPADGRSVLYVPLDRETVLIAGIGEIPPGNLPAILDGDPKVSVPCAVAVLPAAKPVKNAKQPFVAVLSLFASTHKLPQTVTIRSQGHSHPFNFKRQAADLKSFLGMLRDLTTHSEADIVDGLLQVLLAADAGKETLRTVMKVVDGVACADGFIEVLGTFDAGDVFVQGWTRGMPAGTNRVFLQDESFRLGVLACCMFERKDTAGKALGFAGLLEVEGGAEAGQIRRIFFRGRAGWCVIEAHDRKSVPRAHALPVHVRSLLPKLSPQGDALSRLEQTVQRFDGRETISELDVPVRVGIDFGAAVDGAGVLLSGWLLNPEDRVEAVFFRAGRSCCRLDTEWTTQPRPDVTGAFETLSPFLSGPEAQHRHGFLAFLPCDALAAADKPYLEVVMNDGRSAHAPVMLGRSPLRPALRRLVASLDPVTASKPDVIERHLLPLVQSARTPEPAVKDILDIGPVEEDALLSLVVGLDGELEGIRLLLTLCALDPSLRNLPIVLAAAAGDMLEQVEEVRRLADFYGLAVRLVLADHVEDTLDALQAGIASAPAATVACLSATVLPCRAGWLDPLLAAFRAHDERCLVAPTLLYEDETVRWGGAWVELDDRGFQLQQPYVGYPRRTLHGADVAPVAAAPFDCCVLPRSLIAEAGGFSRQYLGTDDKGLDAALRLKRSGASIIWVPQVEMTHAEGGGMTGGKWQRLASDLDRRSFDRIWSAALPALADTLS